MTAIDLFRPYHLHFMLTVHVHSTQLLMLNIILIISTHAYTYLTWHLAFTYIIVREFWLPWTCMFRFWSLDWRGALHWRPSLSLGAGCLAL